MDVFVYIPLHGSPLPFPTLRKELCVVSEEGEMEWVEELSGGSGEEGVCQRPVVSLSFLEQWMPASSAERTLVWSSHPLQLRVGQRDIPRISESRFP